MTLRLTFGADPGLTGAIATLIDGEPGPILDMPTVLVGDWNEVAAGDIARWVRDVRSLHPGAYVSACVEKVGAMPTDGATSAFRFGESSGKLKAVFESLGIPYTRAIPVVWKRSYGLVGEGVVKDDARLLAIRRFPSAAQQMTRKKDIGRADALLIALWHENQQHGARAA